VIRPACATDVDAVQRMAARFLSAEGPYADRFQADPERIAALVAYLTQATDGAAGFIAEQDGQAVGMFGVFSLEHPITGQRVASELCWWMEPEARGSRVGLELLRAAEGWAKAAARLDGNDRAERARGAVLRALGYDAPMCIT
jgi:RimJ/RimL family protein N-acetyltransferase